jgi:YbbR domain-containing protein
MEIPRRSTSDAKYDRNADPIMQMPGLIRLITRNAGWKLLSILAAFLVWLNVASEPELATIVSVPVEYRNYPRDLDISSNIASTIRVEAKGPSRQLRSLSNSGVTAVVDFSSVKGPGERTFTLTATDLNLPRGIDLMRTVPAQLRFQFENRMTRMLRVEVPFSGVLPAGLVVTDQQILPAQLEVRGPESHVLGAKSLVSDPFDLSRVNEDPEQVLSVYAPDPELSFPGAPQVRVKIRVQAVGAASTTK